MSREQLRLQGLRAYELGRLRSACRVAFVLLPLCLLCLAHERGREPAACAAGLLLSAAIWLRWRDRCGVESVRSGLLAGSLPLAAGLGLQALGVRCGWAGEGACCTGFALLIGAAAGVWIGLREQRWQGRLSGWLAAGLIAGLAASLGCLRLGSVGLVSVIAGMALGIVGTALLSARR